MWELSEVKIAVIGLGYVGLPLAVEFAKKYPVVGFDLDYQRVCELENGFDRTREISFETLMSSLQLKFSSSIESASHCNVFIIAVPTPVDSYKNPDLSFLMSASEMVGRLLKVNDVVIYESTVYPGCTEEDCVPVLMKASGLTFNVDFYCGYSPERLNPGDKKRSLSQIKKVTSGSTDFIAEFVNSLYSSIIEAGTHRASSIKVAEASKAVENAQRDLNISFVNELALIFERLHIDTTEVLEAAATKWNFLKYQPGLVGGHCIGVDPYYLVHKAESVGYYPQVILSGRKVNDSMGEFVANKLLKLLLKKGHTLPRATVLILGITFKENCSDIRNSRIVDVYKGLQEWGITVDVYDPYACPNQVKNEYGIELTPKLEKRYNGIVLAVSHDQFAVIDPRSFATDDAVILDIKSVLPREIVDYRL